MLHVGYFGQFSPLSQKSQGSFRILRQSMWILCFETLNTWRNQVHPSRRFHSLQQVYQIAFVRQTQWQLTLGVFGLKSLGEMRWELHESLIDDSEPFDVGFDNLPQFWRVVQRQD